MASSTLNQWARTEGWRRNYAATLPTAGRSIAIMDHLRANPQATHSELLMVAHRDVSQKRIECEQHCENTARAIHALLQKALAEKDGMTIGVLAAAAKGLEATTKIQREALGMVPGVCYRALAKE
ncbi:hypothetical protein ACNBFH_004437 [Salmonella enterica subsp. enterica serovar Bareilly]